MLLRVRDIAQLDPNMLILHGSSPEIVSLVYQSSDRLDTGLLTLVTLTSCGAPKPTVVRPDAFERLLRYQRIWGSENYLPHLIGLSFGIWIHRLSL